MAMYFLDGVSNIYWLSAFVVKNVDLQVKYTNACFRMDRSFGRWRNDDFCNDLSCNNQFGFQF